MKTLDFAELQTPENYGNPENANPNENHFEPNVQTTKSPFFQDNTPESTSTDRTPVARSPNVFKTPNLQGVKKYDSNGRTNTSTSNPRLNCTTPRSSRSKIASKVPSSTRSNEPSAVVAIVEGRGVARGEIGLAAIDLKIPELLLSQFSDSTTYVKVISKLQILSPVEIIMPNTACENGAMSKLFRQVSNQFSNTTITTVQRKYFNETKGLQYVKDLCVPEYKGVELEIASKYYCLATAAALLKYIEFIQNIIYAPHSLKVVFAGSENTCLIDSHSARFLELTINLQNPKSTQSLVGVVNHTKTVSGARLLRANILQPPCDIETIEARLNCIGELTGSELLFYNVQSVLEKFIDVDHLLSLCIQIPKDESVKTAENKINQVICLKHTLELIQPLHESLKDCQDPLLSAYKIILEDGRYQVILNKICEVVQEESKYLKGVLNMKAQKCFAVKPNVNGLLDVARRTYCECVGDVGGDIIHQLAEKYNLPLRVVYNNSRGFFIQISNYNTEMSEKLDQLSALFVKKTKFKNTISFTTEDLIKMNDRIRESVSEIYLMSNVYVSPNQLLSQIREEIIILYKLTDAVAMLDLMSSLACACTLSQYVRPEFTDTLAIKNGRHPILDKMVASVANNTCLCDESRFVIITGPNMSGKSTYLKQVALLQIMAQIGSYVPAEYASFKIVNHIFLRMGSDDDIETNASTFMMEMREANYILQNATENSLIIMDELGRGTAIDEGIALCFAISEQLLSLKAFTLFATHFRELTQLESLYPFVTNFHFEIQQVTNEDQSLVRLEYSHVLRKGVNPYRNYGIKLAEISTLPTSVVEDAKRIAEEIRREKKPVMDGTNSQTVKSANFRLASRIIQVTKNSRLDVNTLKVYMQSLRDEYFREIKANNNDNGDI
uniref:DNA mismatch repair proteins mutS family domain-containing protein n=1 Tax=Strigamia maritima TaxID=126957 RepID=T1IXC0_STRMM